MSLRDGVVTAGKGKGVYLDGEDLTPAIHNVQIMGNTAANGRGYAVYQETVNMQPSFADLAFSGNDADSVMIDLGSAMTYSVTLGGAPFDFVCGFTLCLLNVPNDATLTVQPGTLLKFPRRPRYQRGRRRRALARGDRQSAHHLHVEAGRGRWTAASLMGQEGSRLRL
ncbi:MAG: hypothetical protein R2856_35670 [Caldilineaceae bacterium]